MDKYDKEEIYDNEIAPLMKQIIEICKREDLPFAAQFYLKEEREDTGEPMYCTSIVRPSGESEGHDQILFLSEAMKYGREGKPFVAAYTITRG